MGRLVHESTSTNGHSLFDIHYSDDLADNRRSKTSNGWKTEYTLGDGNRLASSQTTGTANGSWRATRKVDALHALLP